MTVREIKVHYYTAWTDWYKITLSIHAEGQSPVYWPCDFIYTSKHFMSLHNCEFPKVPAIHHPLMNKLPPNA